MRPDEELPLSRQLPLNEDVNRELAHHLAEREKELVAEGWNPVEAAAEARRTFGDMAGVEAECRVITRDYRQARRRAESVESWRQDLTLAVRLLRKSPGFTIAAVLTLALGIGANAAIFSVVNGTLLTPLQYPHSEQLVDLSERHKTGWGNVPTRNMLDWKEQSHSFTGMAQYGRGYRTTLTNQGALSAWNAAVSGDFFGLFGVQPVRGRLPTPDEYQSAGTDVAVVSYDFWRVRLGAPNDLSNQRIKTGKDYQIIGVLPRGFGFPLDVEVWTPLKLADQTMNRTAHNWSTIGRLRPGVTIAEVSHELDTLTAQMARIDGPDFDATGAVVVGLQDQLTQSTRAPLFLLLGASGVLLLAACTNLASSMLARGITRRQEIAVRIALGAGRLRIVRQLFTESLLLALLGTVAGLVVAGAALKLFDQVAPTTIRLNQVHLDGWVLLFTALVGVSTTVLVGLMPALRISGVAPGIAMRAGQRAGFGKRERRVWNALVVTEVALALALLSGSALLIRSFDQVLRTEPGFRVDSLLTVTVALPTSVYNSDPKIEAIWTRALTSIRAIPGVTEAALSNAAPFGSDNSSGSFGIEGVPPGPAGYGPGQGGYRMVSEQYFHTMGIPVVSGREFGDRDNATGAGAIIVNQALARAYFNGQAPVGKRIKLQSGMDSYSDDWITIVGVVGDVHHSSLTAPPRPETYVPMHQRPTRGYSVTLLLHTAVKPEALITPVRNALRELASDIVPTFATMAERIERSQTDRRFTMVILSVFAAIALGLAGVGIYGVVSFTVAQRSREMGIRLALGASPDQVRNLTQLGAMGTVGIGIGLGIVAALITTRVMQTMLYQVSSADPVAFGAATGLLILVAWVASRLPAARVARLDPMITIRAE